MAELGRRDVLSHDAYLARRHYPGLDAIRAAAVLIVMTWHVDSALLRSLDGRRGVQWFFVLSGFLITTLCLGEEERAGRVSLRGFLLRRGHRILPLYLLALAANAFYDLVLVRSGDLTQAWQDTWPYYLTMTQELPLLLEWTGTSTPFPAAWSLAIEEKFYLAWPVLAFVAFRRVRVVLVVVLMIAVGAITWWWPGSAASSLTGAYMSILAGCALAMALRHPTSYRMLGLVLRRPVVLAAVALAVVLPLDVDTYRGAFLAAYPLMIAVVIGGLVVSRSDRAFEHLIAVWIGERSYAIYLFHILSFRLVGEVLSHVSVPAGATPWITLTVGGAITFVLADILRRMIEQPMIARGRRLAARTPSQGQSIATT